VKSRHCAAPNARRVSSTAGGVALAVGAILLFAGALPAQAQGSTNTSPNKTVAVAKTSSAPGAKTRKGAAAPTDAKSTASYSLGVSFGTQLHGQYGIGADALAYDRVLQGLKDALSGKAVAGPDDAKRVQTMITEIHDAAGAANKAAADKFLADNGKLPGIITTASGLQYKVVRQGAGDGPKATDQAVVNYRGTLLDGTEFDSSYKRKEPFTFEVGKVIKGWQEAVQLMKPGSKFELYIPPDLAYGPQSPPPIPPNSLLKFEVELLSVKPAPAAAAPPAGGAMSGPKKP